MFFMFKNFLLSRGAPRLYLMVLKFKVQSFLFLVESRHGATVLSIFLCLKARRPKGLKPFLDFQPSLLLAF